MPNYLLKWRQVVARYTVVQVIPITGSQWLNARINNGTFELKSLLGAWFPVFIIGPDDAPALAIGVLNDPAVRGNYQIVATNCLQLKNFDTGSFFTIVFSADPPEQGFLPVGEVFNESILDDTRTTPPTLTIINVTNAQYCAPWIYDDQAGGLSLISVCDEPVDAYRADTTELTADTTEYTADYVS